MIVHAFTTRDQGDMKKSASNRKRAMQQLFGGDRELLTVPQRHTNKVGVDAVVASRRSVAVGVFSADCVPLLLTDGRVVAAAHAGWKGTLGNIIANTINEMKKNGSDPKNVHAWIGPHIGMCHYDVPEERAWKFLDQFEDDPKVASFFEGRWHVDIGWANYRQLVASGIPSERIDARPMCTACQIDRYFSFRKDSRETFGEMMGVIGFV